MMNTTLVTLAALAMLDDAISALVLEMISIRSYLSLLDSGDDLGSDDPDDTIEVPAALRHAVPGMEHVVAGDRLAALDERYDLLVSRRMRLAAQADVLA